MIIGSWVDATLRKRWIQKLADLCRSNCTIPKSLQITRVEFNCPDPFACGGSADVYQATLGGDESAEQSEQVVVKFLRYYRTVKVKKKKKYYGVYVPDAIFPI